MHTSCGSFHQGDCLHYWRLRLLPGRRAHSASWAQFPTAGPGSQARYLRYWNHLPIKYVEHKNYNDAFKRLCHTWPLCFRCPACLLAMSPTLSDLKLRYSRQYTDYGAELILRA